MADMRRVRNKLALVIFLAALTAGYSSAQSNQLAGGDGASDPFYGEYINDEEFDYEFGEDDYPDESSVEEFGDSIDEAIRSTTPTRRYVIAAVYLIIAVTGVALNSAAIVVSQRCDSLEYSQKVFMQNLAVACLLLVVVVSLLAPYRLLENWVLGSAMCKIVQSLNVLSLCAQAYFAVAVCGDYVVLRKWPQIGEITRTFLEIGTIILGWVFALGFSFPVLSFTEVNDYYGVQRCQLVFPNKHDKHYDLPPASDPFDGLDAIQVDNSTDPMSIMDLPHDNVDYGCKDSGNAAYHRWIVLSFALTFAAPVLACLLLWIASRVIQTNRAVFVSRTVAVPGTGLTARIIKRRRSSNQKPPTARCMPAGAWVSLICVVCFACWTPFYVYHLGRIRGWPMDSIGCFNFEDYSFVQGFLSCALLPALIVAYSRPVAMPRCSKNATTSSTSSFASSASSAGGSGGNRRSTASMSPGPTTDVRRFEVPLLHSEKAAAAVPTTSAV